MQQNVLRWFYQAYVNRVGVHLIELMSGRLAIGAEQYRRLTRRHSLAARPGDRPRASRWSPRWSAAVGSGKSRLIESMQRRSRATRPDQGDGSRAGGSTRTLVDRLRNVRWVEIPGYPLTVEKESRRDRAARQ